MVEQMTLPDYALSPVFLDTVLDNDVELLEPCSLLHNIK